MHIYYSYNNDYTSILPDYLVKSMNIFAVQYKSSNLMMGFPALMEIKLEYFAWEMVLPLLPAEAHETFRLAGLPQQIQ